MHSRMLVVHGTWYIRYPVVCVGGRARFELGMRMYC